MTRKIPLIARDLKKLYTGFLILCVVLFAVCTVLTLSLIHILAERLRGRAAAA